MTKPRTTALRTRSVRRTRTGFDVANIESAHIIAADPVRYPGVMQEWAAAVLRRVIELKEAAA